MGVCKKLLVEVGPSAHQRPSGYLIARSQKVRWPIPQAWPCCCISASSGCHLLKHMGQREHYKNFMLSIVEVSSFNLEVV